MKNKKISPLPWKVQKIEKDGKQTWCAIRTMEDGLVAIIELNGTEMNTANANFIATACNYHEELVSRLGQLLAHNSLYEDGNGLQQMAEKEARDILKEIKKKGAIQ